MIKRIPALLLACVLLCAMLLHPIAEETALPYTLEGYTLILHEGVQAIGRDVKYWLDLDDGEPIPLPMIFERGMIPLKRVIFPSTLRYLGSEAFYAYTFSSIVLPESFENLDDSSFLYCDIGTLVLPSTFQMSMVDGFLPATRIARVEISKAHPYLKSVDGVLYSKDGTTLYYYPKVRRDTFFEVPAGVKDIDAYAFSGNQYLQGVSLPLGLEYIGRGAFADCGRLVSIAFPLTLRKLGDFAFANCVSLQRVSPAPGMALLTTVFSNCPLLNAGPAWQGDEGGNNLKPVQYGNNQRYFNEEGRNLAYSGEGSVQVFDNQLPGSKVIETLPDFSSIQVGEQKGDWLNIRWAAWQGGEGIDYWRDGFVPSKDVIQGSVRNSWRWEEELFTLYGVQPAGPDVPVYAEPFVNKGEAAFRAVSELPYQDFRLEGYNSSIWGDWLSFAYPVDIHEEDGWVDMTEATGYGSVFDFTFTRMRVGDGLTLCLLLPRDRLEPLMTAPGGETLATLVIGTQAEVLEQGADYTRVRVRGQEGYVRTDSVVVVPEENEGGLP